MYHLCCFRVVAFAGISNVANTIQCIYAINIALILHWSLFLTKVISTFELDQRFLILVIETFFLSSVR